MEGFFGEEKAIPGIPPCEALKFEFSKMANDLGESACRSELSEFMIKQRREVSSKTNSWKGIQLAGIKNSIMEVNDAAWALLEEICEDQPMMVVGTTTLIRPPPKESSEDIVAGEMAYQYLRRQPSNDLKVCRLKTGSTWMKHERHVLKWERNAFVSGIYIYPLFVEFEGRKLFFMYPTICQKFQGGVKSKIYNWIVQLSTTVLTLMQVEKSQSTAAGARSEKTLGMKTLTQHFKQKITQGADIDLSEHCSFSWHQTQSILLYNLPLHHWRELEEQERRLGQFVSTLFSSCKEQAVMPSEFKALLDQALHINRVKAAGKNDKVWKLWHPEYFWAHLVKFNELVGSLGKVLFLEDKELDKEFSLFSKKLAEDTLPQYKSRGLYLELLELVAKKSFEEKFMDFKEDYAAKMEVFRDQDNEMEAKFTGIEELLQSAWEAGTLKNFLEGLPTWYEFDLTAIKIEDEDFKLLPQYQLWATKRHDHHERCVRSAVEALELVSQKLESDFAAHFLNPEGVPLPNKVNHSETKGSFKAKESIASLVRTALDKKYTRLLEATETRKAFVEEQLTRNEAELRKKELVILKEQFGLAQNQWNGMAIKKH